MGVASDLYAHARTATGLPDDDFRRAAALVGLAVAVLVLLAAMRSSKKAKNANEPPVVPYSLPIIGSALEYGKDPVNFLLANQAKYGECFTLILGGQKATFFLGPDGNHFLFNVPLANASAEGVYRTLTVPVFGAEVVYDVENAVFMEQKKFVKDALNTTAFRSYVPMIWEETVNFLKEWKENPGTLNIFEEMSELTIRTAARCLLGKEVRSQLHSNVAKLYHDLDAGLAPINLVFRWLPLPAYINRDRAHKIMTDLFTRILRERRANNDTNNQDLMQTLMNSRYRDGSVMSENAIAHLMIATLMGGQHTSSTTVSWILFELSRRPDVVAQLLEEQSKVLTGKPDTPVDQLPAFDYEQLREFAFLDCVMKETLRLHPPIHTVMRKVTKPLNYKGFHIAEGTLICGAASVSQVDPARFPNPTKFEPSRFINNDEGAGEWTIGGVDIAQKSARSHFLPFGAGRHRCIGEAFAYTQIKTIVSIILRKYSVKLPISPKTGEPVFPKPDYTSLIVLPQKPAELVVTPRA
ncbi:Lanosterol 14-alpha-demethylase [Polyrhizophydium stewartii]|uniref:Lanosterol 14-alpha-demethylase n=1 Tax=Polyrhizophydium stewartii TaxID=2732419 RepID=A0ABR4NF65_9FUNG